MKVILTPLPVESVILFEDSVSHLPEHNEEIELSIEFPVVMMVGSTIWTSH